MIRMLQWLTLLSDSSPRSTEDIRPGAPGAEDRVSSEGKGLRGEVRIEQALLGEGRESSHEHVQG